MKAKTLRRIGQILAIIIYAIPVSSYLVYETFMHPKEVLIAIIAIIVLFIIPLPILLISEADEIEEKEKQKKDKGDM